MILSHLGPLSANRMPTSSYESTLESHSMEIHYSGVMVGQVIVIGSPICSIKMFVKSKICCSDSEEVCASRIGGKNLKSTGSVCKSFREEMGTNN